MPRLRQHAIEDRGDAPLTSPAPELSSGERDEMHELFHYFGLDEDATPPPETVATPADSAPVLDPKTPKGSVPQNIKSPSPVEFESKVTEFDDE
jgi:hypothetical protein